MIARISLITLILLAPASARITSNSVFSSAAAAPAAGAAATATAAETPHFSSNILDKSAASITVNADNSSTNLAKSAIFFLQNKI